MHVYIYTISFQIRSGQIRSEEHFSLSFSFFFFFFFFFIKLVINRTLGGRYLGKVGNTINQSIHFS